MNGETRSEFDSAAETPFPRECDSNKKINLKETRGETRKNTVRILLREARGEAKERGRELLREGICAAGHGQQVPISPLQLGFHEQFPHFLPISTAQSCPCQELFLWPLISSLPVLTDPSPAPLCPALPCSLSVSAGTKVQLTQTLMKVARGCCCCL